MDDGVTFMASKKEAIERKGGNTGKYKRERKSAPEKWLGEPRIHGSGNYHHDKVIYNFHHRYPTDYRNGIRWYDWDPSKWLIFLLSKFHLAWDLKRTIPLIP